MKLKRHHIVKSFFIGVLIPLIQCSTMISAHAKDGLERLILIGGGPRPPEALERFVEWSGGPRSKILVITHASQIPHEVAGSITRSLTPAKPGLLIYSYTAPATSAEKNAFLKQLKECTGIFFSGGDQTRAMKTFEDPEIRNALEKRVRGGLAIAGTSAGTAMQSSEMIAGTAPTTDGLAPTQKGLGLLPSDIIIDQHFFVRERWKRLLPLISARPEALGIGIEEGGAIAVIGNQKIEVLGNLKIMIADSKASQGGDPLVYALYPGDQFDLKTRMRIRGTPPGEPLNPKFGPEFTISNSRHLDYGSQLHKVGLRDSRGSYQALKRSLRELHALQTAYCQDHGCEITPIKNSTFSLRIAGDAAPEIVFSIDENVIEIKTPPMTEAQITEWTPEFQKILFDQSARLDLRPQSLYGSGHISIDLESGFSGELKTLVNFMTDFFNHPGLALGPLEFDPYNALPFVSLSRIERSNYQQIVEEVWTGQIRDVQQFVDAMRSRVYGADPERSTKFHSLNVDKLAEKDPARRRLEIRSLRAQKNAGQYALLTRLFAAKLEKIRQMTARGTRLELIPQVGINSPSQALGQFYFYVQDAELDYTVYRKELLNRFWKAIPPEQDRSLAFRDMNACGRLLQKVIKKASQIFNRNY